MDRKRFVLLVCLMGLVVGIGMSFRGSGPVTQHDVNKNLVTIAESTLKVTGDNLEAINRINEREQQYLKMFADLDVRLIAIEKEVKQGELLPHPKVDARDRLYRVCRLDRDGEIVFNKPTDQKDHRVTYMQIGKVYLLPEWDIDPKLFPVGQTYILNIPWAWEHGAPGIFKMLYTATVTDKFPTQPQSQLPLPTPWPQACCTEGLPCCEDNKSCCPSGSVARR